MTCRKPTTRRRRALTLVEMVLALSVTTLIAGAIAGMMAAVSTGVSSKRDMRSTMLRAHATMTRLSTYLAAANCVLTHDGQDLAIWLNDSRKSDTVHASEIRWIRFDSSESAIFVHYVAFPDSWTKLQINRADIEYPKTANWDSVFQAYDAIGQIKSVRLIDTVSAVAVETREAPLAARLISFDIDFTRQQGNETIRLSPTIRRHEEPAL